MIKWSAPFLVALMLVHTFLNPAFPIEFRLGQGIPYRPLGFAYANIVAERIFTLSVIAAHWLSISRDDFVETLIRLRLPGWALLLLVQSVAMAELVSRRTVCVYQAQQARGIPVAGSFAKRAKALLTILIPVVVSTLVEIDERATCLQNRGFGNARPEPVSGKPWTASERSLVIGVMMLTIVALIAEAVR